jgi:hypothetical protein
VPAGAFVLLALIFVPTRLAVILRILGTVTLSRAALGVHGDER